MEPLSARLVELGFAEEDLFAPKQAPEDCPWRMEEDADDSPAGVIAATLAPVSGVLPRLVRTLTERTTDTAIVRLHGVWAQVYDLGGSLYMGGPPDPAPVLSEAWDALGWTASKEMARLYAVHGGFGPLDHAQSFWFEKALLPAPALQPLTFYIRFGEEDLEFDPNDYVLFFTDGEGGGQCMAPGGQTVSWNGEHREIGAPLPFFAFVDTLLS